MKKTLNVLLAAGAAASFCTAALAQQTPATNPGSATQPTGADTKVWQQANQMNENHITLNLDLAGEWATTTKFWATPGAPEQTSTGKSTFMPVLGGRFVQQEFTGQIMGDTFKGFAWFGFNNGTQKFENVWIDSESTGLLVTTGTRGQDGTITFTGNFADPVTGQKKATRSTMTWTDKNTVVFSMFDTSSDGQEFKNLEVTYVRVAPPKQIDWKAQKAQDNAPAGQSVSTTPNTGATTTSANADGTRPQVVATPNPSKATPSTQSNASPK